MVKKMRLAILGSTVAGVCLFSGCLFWSRGHAISEEGYNSMINSSFSNIKDVVALFPTNVADVEARRDYALKNAKKQLHDIIDVPDVQRTFENTARALDNASSAFAVGACALHVTEEVHPDKGIRDACHEAVLSIQKFSVDAFLSPELYKAFNAYMNGNFAKEKCSPEEKTYLDETMKGFRYAGLHLPESELKEVKRLQKELAELELEFSRAINSDKSSFTATEEELAGVDKHLLANLKKTDDGKFIVTCDYPTSTEVSTNCSVSETRCRMNRAFNNRAYPANKKTLETIIAKRDELAKRLGFESFAHYDLDNQMAKNPATAISFIQELAKKVAPKEKKEFERLCSDLPVGVVLVDGKFAPWDVGYTVEAYKKKHFKIDEREIAEYFPMEKTIQGIFDIYQKFLGLTFTLEKPSGLWHEDVSVIKITRDGILEGYVLLDLYPRDDKYSHACMSPMVPASVNGDVKVPAVITVIANFPKSTKERPSLLKHRDVETFFHEFGHAMHGVLGKTSIKAFSGTETKRDFVEVPSQMFEEWMWDKSMLKMVSSHYKTGQPLPDELINKMVELKQFDSGYFVQRQCCLSLFALAYFDRGAQKDVDAIWRSIHEKFVAHVQFDPETHKYASFGHLTEYAAKYYGYMWSKVFALDIFDAIRKEGLLDPKIGEKLTATVLGRGGSADPSVLLKDFLGREPNQDAFLKDIGV